MMKGVDERIDEDAPRCFKKQSSGCQTSKENGVCEEKRVEVCEREFVFYFGLTSICDPVVDT